MRHRKKWKKIKRKSSQRKALIRNQAISLILNNKIKTTLVKAKVLRPFVEKLITIGKKDDLASKRHLYKLIANKKAVFKIRRELVPKYKIRKGGYTRIIKLGTRKGDSAKTAQIEFV